MNGFINGLRQRVDIELRNTPFPRFETLTFQFVRYFIADQIRPKNGDEQNFVNAATVEFLREIINFSSIIRSGAFSGCSHHLRKIIEINASFCFVLKYFNSDFRYSDRYLTYPNVWRYKHLLNKPDLQGNQDFQSLQNQSKAWCKLYEVDNVNSIKDWRGFKKGRRFTLAMMFNGIEVVYRRIFPNYNEDPLLTNYYDLLCQQVHFSPVGQDLADRIIGIPVNPIEFCEPLTSAASELIRFFLIGNYFEVFEYHDNVFAQINQLYDDFNQEAQDYAQ